ncbi:MAG: hypothetical protein HOP19_05200 [Acidobacteria bacterium]|nr:hypothetical protein [Acidobacteriota bacterium]
MKFWRQRKDEELDAEIRSHLDETIRDRLARGEAPDEAHQCLTGISLSSGVFGERAHLRWMEA